MNKILVIFFFCITCFLFPLQAQQIIEPDIHRGSYFAIIIDQESYQFAKAAVHSYRQSIENRGLGTYILIDQWQNPDEVKSQIIKIHNSRPGLEGVVFIGDVPIAMIRNAQHLTSAFKIIQNSERYSWQKTSVPSDRFYDDFDLRFTYIKQDSSNLLLHYYSLDPDSPQKIECDIYSARIKPPVEDKSKYRLILDYLTRISEQKKENYDLDRAMIFTGHGYHSESLGAWSGSILRYREQFPQLFSANGQMLTFNHSMRSDMKSVILRELQNPNLDIAVFHAHGATDTQYLLGFDPAESISENVESIKLFLRSKLRQAKRRNKSVAETQLDYMQRYQIPMDWFKDAWSDSMKLVDSLLYASQDIYIEDMKQIQPGGKFIYFDECFNGAYFRTPYMAGTYLFNNGHVIVTAANSVNVRQDIWASEHLGLLNYGYRIGQWLKLKNSLELHIIGDPTFNFKAKDNIDINNFLNRDTVPEKELKTWLNNTDVPLQVLAITELFKNKGIKFEDKLIQLYDNQVSYNVRLKALTSLAQLRSRKFEEILFKSINDPSEFIRRVTVFWMGDIGKKEYLSPLVNAFIWDSSSRVRFNSKAAIEKISAREAIPLCQQHLDSKYKSTADKRDKYIISSLKRSIDWLNNDLLKRLEDSQEKIKKRVSAARTFRNYRFHEAVPNLIQIALDQSETPQIRDTVIEALGWFTYSVEREQILIACDKILNQDDLPVSLKNETIMTQNRILQGPNNPILP